MLDHAFQWVDRVWFHVSPDNIRSQKAMERIGGKLSHRGQMSLTGSLHEYLFYKIEANKMDRGSTVEDGIA